MQECIALWMQEAERLAKEYLRAADCNLSKAEGARKLIELAGTGYKATPDLDSDGGYSL